MNRFAQLLDRLVYEPRRNAKIRLIADYFSRTPDPERGIALAAMTDQLVFREAKPNVIRALVAERVDPELFRMSYHYVGDLAETVALIWPRPEERVFVSAAPALQIEEASSPPPRGEGPGVGGEGQGAASLPHRNAGGVAGVEPDGSVEPGSAPPTPTPSPRGGGEQLLAAMARDPEQAGPTLSEVVATLARTGKSELPGRIAEWLDALDETGRWALIKLITGSLRVGVSARLAKTAVAAMSGERAIAPDEVELVWHGLKPPYEELFAWVEGRGERPASEDAAPFRPPMLSHPLEEEDFDKLDPADYVGEWKWDGIRLQAVAGRRADGTLERRIYSRTAEEVSAAFPDLVEALRVEAALDGELLIVREGRVQSFNVLQQRLNRKTVTAKLMADFPAHFRVYDLLAEGEEDLRDLPFAERRARLERLVERIADPRISLSQLVPFATFDELAAARADPASAGAGEDAEAVEGVMIKRRESPYLPGRPKGHWWKWKRSPHLVDAVMMYGQRGHGKRSSFFSDYTFGVWREGEGGEELVPVGKAYHGITDEELAKLDRYVRNNTVNRFGPVREVAYGPDKGLVLEIAFEGLQRSTRHKSGLAMRFPRIHRIRWDKPPREADRIGTLEKILERGEQEVHPLKGA